MKLRSENKIIYINNKECKHVHFLKNNIRIFILKIRLKTIFVSCDCTHMKLQNEALHTKTQNFVHARFKLMLLQYKELKR